jgi:hypothetical protein
LGRWAGFPLQAQKPVLFSPSMAEYAREARKISLEREGLPADERFQLAPLKVSSFRVTRFWFSF